MRDGRARGEAEPRPDRTEHPQRAERGPGEAHSLFQPPPHPLLARKERGGSGGTSAMPKPGQSGTGGGWSAWAWRAATRGNPLQPSKASVRLDPDGVATVRMAMTDIGTGTYTILTQIAAEMLGLPTERPRGIGRHRFSDGARVPAVPSAPPVPARHCSTPACNLRAKLARAAGMDPARCQLCGWPYLVSAGVSNPLMGLVGRRGHRSRRRDTARSDAERITRSNPMAPTLPKSAWTSTRARSAFDACWAYSPPAAS